VKRPALPFDLTTRDLVSYEWDPATGEAVLIYENGERRHRATVQQRRWAQIGPD
jgi:hypothetical protein